jgi:hypothetical protein
MDVSPSTNVSYIALHELICTFVNHLGSLSSTLLQLIHQHALPLWLKRQIKRLNIHPHPQHHTRTAQNGASLFESATSVAFGNTKPAAVKVYTNSSNGSSLIAFWNASRKARWSLALIASSAAWTVDGMSMSPDGWAGVDGEEVQGQRQRGLLPHRQLGSQTLRFTAR